jgi:recombination protein RecT
MSKDLTTLEYIKGNEDKIKKRIGSALPKHIDPNRMMSVLKFELNQNPALNRCTPQSIITAFIQSSRLGLEPGNALGQSYLIPYGNRCQFIIGYKGMIDLARRSGQLISISAHVVFENDLFEFEFGLNEKLKHIPARDDRGKFVCAYAYAKLSNTFDNSGRDSYQFDVMFQNEIEEIRMKSPNGRNKTSPWETHYQEMAKKTVIRRLFKYLPISVEAQRAAVVDEAYERGEEDNFIDLSDIETIDDKPQTKSDALSQKINLNDSAPIQNDNNPKNFDDKLKAYEQANKTI